MSRLITCWASARRLLLDNLPPLHPNAVRYAERDLARDVVQKILVVVDPTASAHPCVEKAARLAASFGSSLELFICDAEMAGPGPGAASLSREQRHAVLREQRMALLEPLAAPLRARGIHVTTESVWQVPLTLGIVTHAIRSGADLVVKDTHAHAPSTHMPTVQTDWILIRQVPVPLLLVHAGAWPAHPRIAASVDPGGIAERPATLDQVLLSEARTLGRALMGEVEVLHALQGPPHLGDEQPSAAVRSEFRSRERAAVEQFVESGGVSCDAIRFIDRRMPEGVVDLVHDRRPDILVIGAAGRSRFPGSVASTASQVLEQVACDLLVMKPPGFVSPVLVRDP